MLFLLKKNFNFLIYYFIFIIFIGAIKNFLDNTEYDNTWTIGEWLINYSGGFIRRGLFGSIIYEISNLTKISPIFFVHFISLFSYIFLLNLLWYTKKYFSKLFLLSPIVGLCPILGDFLIRKDLFGIAIYGFCTFLIKESKDLKSIFLINVFSIIAILNHESFVFYAIPSFIILNIFCNYDLNHKNLLGLFVRSIIFLMPSLIVTFLVFYYRTSPSIAIDIHHSWQALSNIMPSSKALFLDQPLGAINSVGWNFNNSKELLIRAILGKDSFSFVLYIPAVWMLTIFVVGQIFIGDGENSFVRLKANVLLVQFASISPLFLLGWDYGRWIFLWIGSSIFFTTALIEISKKNKILLRKIENLSPKYLMNKMKGLNLQGKWKIVYLFISIPHCCWTISNYFWKTPIFYPFSLILK